MRFEQLEARDVPAAGDLDPSFGTGGRLTDADLGGVLLSAATGVVLQPDGRIVLASSTRVAGNTDFAAARLNPDGTPDETFGPNGKRVVAFDLGGPGSEFMSDFTSGIVLQPDGKIVLAGSVEEDVVNDDNGDFAVARLNPDGTPDKSFGPGGKRVIAFDLGAAIGLVQTFHNLDLCYDIAVQADGKIVLAGSATSGTGSGTDFAVARLNPDGTPDESFGPGGKRVVAFDLGSGNSDIAYDVTIQPDGKIVLVGDVQTSEVNNSGSVSNIHDMGVVRLNPDGTPDESFGPGGKRAVAFGSDILSSDAADAVLIQPDGRLVVVGGVNSTVGADTVVAAARLNPDGTADESFGPGGKRTYGVGFAFDAARQADGRLVLVGYVPAPVGEFNDDFLILRLDPDGTPDEMFGPGGVRSVPFDLGGSLNDNAGSVVIQPDGRAVVAGGAATAGLALIRLGDVPPPNTAPAAADDAAAVPFGSPAVAIPVRANDTDADGHALTVVAAGPAASGTVAVVGGGVVYQPAAGFSGTDTFPYTVSDGNGGTATATVTITVGPPPPAPPPSPPAPPARVALRAVGADAGGGPRVRAFRADGSVALDVFAFESTFAGGVRVSTADVNGDGVDDVLAAAGDGGGPRVRVFDGATGAALRDFFAFPDTLRVGAFVRAADLTGDGFADFVVTAGAGGGPRVAVFDGRTGDRLGPDFFAFDPDGRAGYPVALGDVTGDGAAEVLVGEFGGGSGVRVFDVAGRLLAATAAFEPTFLGGVTVAVGDADGDGTADVVVGAGAGAARLRAFRLVGGALTPAGADLELDGDTRDGVRVGSAGAGVVAGFAGRTRSVPGGVPLPGDEAPFGADYVGGVWVS